MSKILGYARKYKLLHIVFWLWHLFDTYHGRQELYGGGWMRHLPVSLVIVAFQIICVYLIIYFLIPKFLYQSRYGMFMLFSGGIIVAGGFLTFITLNIISSHLAGKRFSGMFFQTITTSIDLLIVSIVFVAIILIANWYEKDRLNKLLEKDKLEAELNFLKAQINPHFLFNTLNSIYVLIKRDQDKAGDTVLKLAALLRYQIYDCKENFTLLDKELAFISDYISLEKMRSTKNLEISFDAPPGTQDTYIAPFILMPFIENAFKHVSRRQNSRNFIIIKTVPVLDKEIEFSVTNSYDDEPLTKKQKGGIGLENVNRRLDALYPGQYSLQIEKSSHVYSVNLKLHAKNIELHRS